MSQKDKQMKIVIEEIQKGKSRKEAAEIANIPRYRIVHWYNEGKHGFGKDNIEFYNKLKNIEDNQNNQSIIHNSNKFKERYYCPPSDFSNKEKIEFKKYPQGNLRFQNAEAKSDRNLSSRPHYLFEGDYYNAEYYAIEYYKSQGYNAFFSENTSWKGLLRCLFKDILVKFKKYSKNNGYTVNYWDKEHFNHFKNEIHERFYYLKRKSNFCTFVFQKLGNYRRKDNVMKIC